MKEEYLKSPTVKLLQATGFSDDYIEKGIENGDIIIEKAKSTEEMDRSEKFQKENIKNDEKHIKDLERDKKEDEYDEKDLKRDKKSHEDKEKKDDMEKGLSADLMKSLGDSIGASMAETLTPIFKGLNARMDAQDELLKSISKQAPDFRSGDLDKASTIEKSMAFKTGDDGKTELNIITQRPVVKKVIEKALEDPEIQKAYGEDAIGYLMCPEADTVGKGIAQYLYDKQNIKLVK